MPNSYLSYYGSLFPATSTAPPYPSTSLEPAIKDLITPGLVPDIARQSAEVSAGRGIAGSPAAGSTAVRMSEQNYLQRLALANNLLSGQASRDLPYQITPYQSAGLGLHWQQLQDQLALGRRGGGGSGGGQRPAPGAPRIQTPWAGFSGGPLDVGAFGTRPDSSGSGTGINLGGYGGYGGTMGLDGMISSLLGSGDPTTDTPWDWGTGTGEDAGGDFGDYFGD